ncbi:hypothetical protein LMIY3S_03716 [Labrys miyagiensis]
MLPLRICACYNIGMKPIAERLWAKTEIRGPDECWNWLGWRHPSGAGQIGRGKRSEGLAYTHVVSWEVTNGPVPETKCVYHRCENLGCVNPHHLFIGTPADRSKYLVEQRRHSYGEAQATKLNDAAVRDIRGRLIENDSQRILAEQFGVSRSMIGLVGQFERWKLTDTDTEVQRLLLSRPKPGESDTCVNGHSYSEVGFYKGHRSGRVCKACHKLRVQRYLDSGGLGKKRERNREYMRSKASS